MINQLSQSSRARRCFGLVRTTRCQILALALALGGTLIAQPASAHFPWLVVKKTQADTPTVQVYFGEVAQADDPELLSHISEATLVQLDTAGETGTPLSLVLTERDLSAQPTEDAHCGTFYLLTHNYGVTAHGGHEFLLRYYAKTGPPLGSAVWNENRCAEAMPLDLSATPADGAICVVARWQGELQADVQITVAGPGIVDQQLTTDAQGAITFQPGRSGRYSLRARHVEICDGEYQGETYARIHNYSTLSIKVPEGVVATTTNDQATEDTQNATTAAEDDSQEALPEFADMPQDLTSFGGAITSEAIYAYGGHTGTAHSYSDEEQSDQLWRHSLTDLSSGWEPVLRGPRVQGLALVAWEEKLYRIGGFTAMNAVGEDHNLVSQASVDQYDPQTNQWTAMAPLPEPRSSLDAAVLDGVIYVAGGWQLTGGEESEWHTTAWRLDLKVDDPQWEAIANPPFERRALAIAAHQNKIYVIGGIAKEGGPSNQVDIYDPQTNQWSEGPSLECESQLAGFGCAAFATEGRLYASLANGSLRRLSQCNQAPEWEEVQRLERARFFHRMLPLAEGRFVFFGGADMSVGKFHEVDVIDVP